MIRCCVPRCPHAATKSVMVRCRGYPDQAWLTCIKHREWAWKEAMRISGEREGSVHTSDITIPQRRVSPDDLVHIHTHIPRELHSRMILTSQGRRMSQRAYVSRALNNQIMIDEMGARKDDHK